MGMIGAKISRTAVVETLHHQPIFKFATEQEIKDLSRHTIQIEKAKDDLLLLEGGAVIGLYIITSGQAGVFPGRHKDPIATINEGELLGEISLIEGSKASATIKVLSTSLAAILIESKAFHDYLDSHQEFSVKFFRGVAATLADRLKAMNFKLLTLTASQKTNLAQVLSPRQMAETIQHIVDNNISQQHANTSTSIGVLEALKTLALENPSVAPALVSIGKDLSKMMETNLRDEKNYASQIAQLKEMLRAIEETVYTALPR